MKKPFIQELTPDLYVERRDDYIILSNSNGDEFIIENQEIGLLINFLQTLQQNNQPNQ